LKKYLLLLLFLLVPVSVLSEPSTNPIFVSEVEFVEYVESVNSLESQVPTIDVAGTDYYFDDDGRIFLQLSENGLPINDAFCEIDVYYPDNSPFMSDMPLTFLENGLYYRDFFVPNISGVYMINAYCEYDDFTNYFYVSNLSYDGDLKDKYTDDVNNFVSTDCLRTYFDKIYSANYTFSDSLISNINISDVEALTIYFVGSFERDFIFQLYNYSDNSWVDFYYGSGIGGLSEDCYSNMYLSFEINDGINNFVSGSEIIFRTLIDNGDDSKVIVDEVGLIFHHKDLYLNNLRGGGELNVKPTINQVFNFSILTDRFDLLDNLIYSIHSDLSSEHNYSQSLIINLDNDLQVHDTDIKNLISNLASDVSDLEDTCNANYNALDDRIDILELKIDLLLEKLNIVTNDLNINVDTIDCLEGSNWVIDVTVQDNFGNYLTDNDVYCDLETDLFGNHSLVYDGDSFVFQTVCGFGTDIINWVVNCEEI